MRRIVDENYQRARNILSEHNGLLEKIAQSLLERETLDLKDVDAIINEIEPGLLSSLKVKVRTYNIKAVSCEVESAVTASAPELRNEQILSRKYRSCFFGCRRRWSR